MAFMGLKGGDRIVFVMPNGAGQPWVKKSARVQPLLVFENHVVVNLGGQYGTPYVVNVGNFLKKVG